MNQDSLNSYKSQVYNPGSPHPSPTIEPFRAFPKDLNFSSSKVNPENPLKITFSAKRKRDSNEDKSPESMSPSKKSKMLSTEQANEFFQNLTKQFQETQKEVNSGMRDDMTVIKNELANMRSSQEKASEDDRKEKEAFKEQFKIIESRLESLETSKNTQADNPPSPSFMNNSSETAWKASLAKDVFVHEHGLVVHGIKLEGTDDKTRAEFFSKFLKTEMKVPDDTIVKIRIKEVTRLGAENEAKPPPILVKFGHPTERNSILPFSKNLKRGISIDKFVPKMYLQKHKDFKRHAWKLKSLFNIQSQVVFDAHNLVVRYKKKDDGTNKYNWVIAKEYHPQPEDSLLSRAESRDPSKLDTPILDMSTNSACNRSIIVSGVPDNITATNAELEFRKLLDNKYHTHLEEIIFKIKGTVVIVCKDWTGCKQISDVYQQTKMFDKELALHLFSETDPNL